MKEYNKLLLALSMASKVIIKPEGAETIKTVKNVIARCFFIRQDQKGVDG